MHIFVIVIYLNIFFVILNTYAMDQTSLSKDILIVTSDNKGHKTPRSYIDEMSVLSHMLACQEEKGNVSRPLLRAGMIDSEDFQLVKEAIARKNHFDCDNDLLKQYCDKIAQEEGLLEGENPKIKYTLGSGKLRKLVNAAYEVGAESLSELFVDYYLIMDIQKSLSLQKNDSIISSLNKRSFEKRKILLQKPEKFEGLSLCFSPDNKKIIAGGIGKQTKLFMWDISDINNPSITAFKISSEGDYYPGNIMAVLPSKDGKKIVVVRKDNDACKCDLSIVDMGNMSNPTYTTIFTFPVHKIVKIVALSPDDKMIVAVCENLIMLYDIHDIKNPIITTLLNQKNLFNCLAFSHDSKKIAIGGTNEKRLTVCDISDINTPIFAVIDDQHSVFDVMFGPDDKKIIAYCGNDDKRNLMLWDISDIKKSSSVVFGQDIGLGNIAFRFDGRKIIFRKEECLNIANIENLTMWDINDINHPFVIGKTEEEIYVFSDRDLAISSDNKIILGNVMSRLAEESGLMLSAFLRDEEISSLKLVSFSQGQSLYKLTCLNVLGGGKVVPKQDNQYYSAFMRLPQNIRELLQSLS